MIARTGCAALLAAALAATAAHAQVAKVQGKVVDATGKPIPGATITVSSENFKDQVYTGKSDKHGRYRVDGVLTSEQYPNYRVEAKADGYVPAKANLVARTADRTRYYSGEPNLSPRSPAVVVAIKALAEIDVDFTMKTGEAEPAQAAIPEVPTGAGAPPAGGGAPQPAAPDSFALAIGKVRDGDAEASVDLFKKAIEEKPDDWERRNVFAAVLLHLDRQGEATIQAKKAVGLAPDKAAPLITLADIYTARGLADKASGALEQAAKLEPDNPKVLERTAAAAAEAGKTDEALALYEKVLAQRPDNIEVLLAAADLYNRKNEPKKAEAMLDKVVQLDPKNAYRTFYNLGVVIQNRRDLTEADHRKAIEAFRKAIDLKPDYAIAHRDLAFALLGTNQLGAARKELQRYVELAPNAKDAADIKETIKSLPAGK